MSRLKSFLDKIFLPLFLLAIVVLTGLFFFPEFIKAPIQNEKIQIEIKENNNIENITKQKNQEKSKDEKIENKTSSLNASNLNISSDKSLVLVKSMGVDPTVITKQESFKSKTNDHNQITQIHMNYGHFRLLEKKDSDKPLKEYKTPENSFWFTDYLYKEQITPLINQLDKWQEENNRPVQMRWNFEYTSEDALYPIYMNLQIYSPQTKEDITIPLNINLMLYNKLEDGNINYVSNIKTEEVTNE